MLEYDRTDIFEEIDVNITNVSKECDICHYWYFLSKNLSYEPYLCNGCHDVMLMQRATSFTDVAIVSIKGSDYRIYFWYMSKDDVINIMNNSNLNKKGPCCNFLFYYYYVKMS